jgi:hypothetical protein
MKKIMLAVVMITVLCLLAGCKAAAVLMPSVVGDDGDEKVMYANAMNISTAINAYNALNSDDTISEIPPLAELKEKLGELYPPHISDEEAEKALKLIEMKDGVTSVRED